MKRFAFLVLALIAAMQLTACNTMQGLGKDIKKGGEAIERAAN